MNFTVDWFSDHIPTWERLVLPRLKDIRWPSYLEIGVHEGRSLCWMLDNIPALRAVCIDPLNLDGQYESFINNVGQRAELYREKSHDTLYSDSLQNPFHDKYFDCIYIDGSHWARDVLFDTILCWDLLNKGGVMIWDDYGWLIDDDPIKGPKKAVDAFLTCYRTEYKVLHIGYQFIVEKV